METLIWIGTLISLAGLGGIIWCILAIVRVRRAGLDDNELRKSLAKLIPINIGSLFCSVAGLVLVILGIAMTR